MALPPFSAHVDDYVCLTLGILGAGLYWLWTAWGTQQWPSTDGRVLSAATAEHTDDDGATSYRPTVSYEDQVNGTLYRSDRVSPGPQTFGRYLNTVSDAIGGYLEAGRAVSSMILRILVARSCNQVRP